jgi:hypothetical protein
MSNALKHVKAIPNKNGCRCVVVVVLVLLLLLVVVVVPLTTFPVQFVFQNTCPAPGAPPSPELVAAVQHFSWGKIVRIGIGKICYSHPPIMLIPP